MQFEQLGPYRLGKKLGQGGMGAVYAGVDTESGEAAAIKVLSPRLAVDESFRVRFEAEIESLKKLRHPNIVRLYGYGEQAGTLFYAMELVEGHSLEDELRAGRRFDWREVTQIAIKLCRALKHAHDHGVIHRDLKPANLLLTPDGDIKLSDFGIARLFGNTRLTADGGVLGTAEFMAPEQADGRMVTDRCDQYSLGGVMYALLAGRPPFRAKTLVEMLQLQRYAEPEPVTRYAPSTPVELSRIIGQLLEKDPQKRFANTLILARSLEAMERGLSISPERTEAEFVLTPPGALGEVRQPLAPTMTPTQLAEQHSAEAALSQATAATMDYSAYAAQAQARATVSESTPASFTKVDEPSEHSSGLGELLAGLLAPQTLALALALLVVLGGGWYLLRPESADALYTRIAAAADSGDLESMKAARPAMQAFLTRYADDPRAAQVRSLEEESQQSSPIQRAFAEARRQALLRPDIALAQYSAIVDVYDDGPQTPDQVKRYIALARVQQERLQPRVERYIAEGRKLIEARLAKADQLAASDGPAARRIYSGIVELYRNTPWADDLVQRARSGVEKNAAQASVE